MYVLAKGVSAEQALREAGWGVTPSRIAFLQKPFRRFGGFTGKKGRYIAVNLPRLNSHEGGHTEAFLLAKHVTTRTKMCK